MVQIFGPIWSYALWWGILLAIITAYIVIYKAVMFAAGKTLKRTHSPPEALNDLRFAMRLIVGIIIIITFVAISENLIPGGIPAEIAVLLSAIMGTVIALSTTSTIQNFIAGLYIIITSPYKVGDLVRVGEHEGIVVEISLNNTKIRKVANTLYMPSNQGIVNSRITNFTLSAEDAKSIGISLPKRAKEITRYSFDVEIPRDNPLRTKQILKSIADKHAEHLFQAPEIYTVGLNHRPVVSVIFMALDPEILLDLKNEFLLDFYKAFYSR